VFSRKREMLIFTIKPQGGSYFQDIRPVDTLAGKFGLLAGSEIVLEIKSVLNGLLQCSHSSSCKFKGDFGIHKENTGRATGK
jgi:hypothetical protein